MGGSTGERGATFIPPSTSILESRVKLKDLKNRVHIFNRASTVYRINIDAPLRKRSSLGNYLTDYTTVKG